MVVSGVRRRSRSYRAYLGDRRRTSGASKRPQTASELPTQDARPRRAPSRVPYFLSVTVSLTGGALPPAPLATAISVSLTDLAFLKAFLALPVSLIFSVPGAAPASLPTTTAFLPSLSFLAVALSSTSWMPNVHALSHDALATTPLA